MIAMHVCVFLPQIRDLEVVGSAPDLDQEEEEETEGQSRDVVCACFAHAQYLNTVLTRAFEL